jgi:hypothetical protein
VTARTADRHTRALYRVLAIAILALATAGVHCVRPAAAAEPSAADPTTSALTDALRDLGRGLVQRQLPKGAPALPDTHPMLRHALDAAPIVAEEASMWPEATRIAAARMVFTMGGFESGWQADPKGSNDDGGACSFGQVHSPERYLPGATCAVVRKDLRLGIRVTFAVVALLTQRHGTMAAGLTAYATGSYKGWILAEVTRRCALAGVACSTVRWSETAP